MFGAVAQLVAHLHGMQGVRGSSPLSSTKQGFAGAEPVHEKSHPKGWLFSFWGQSSFWDQPSFPGRGVLWIRTLRAIRCGGAAAAFRRAVAPGSDSLL